MTPRTDTERIERENIERAVIAELVADYQGISLGVREEVSAWAEDRFYGKVCAHCGYRASMHPVQDTPTGEVCDFVPPRSPRTTP